MNHRIWCPRVLPLHIILPLGFFEMIGSTLSARSPSTSFSNQSNSVQALRDPVYDEEFPAREQITLVVDCRFLFFPSSRKPRDRLIGERQPTFPTAEPSHILNRSDQLVQFSRSNS